MGCFISNTAYGREKKNLGVFCVFLCFLLCFILFAYCCNLVYISFIACGLKFGFPFPRKLEMSLS